MHLPVIRSLDTAPPFWNMTLEELKSWHDSVIIETHIVEEYYQAALAQAVYDVAKALDLLPTPKVPVQSDDDPEIVDGKQLYFKRDGCDLRDLVFMCTLGEMIPFSLPGQKGKLFMECAQVLKVIIFLVHI